VYDSTVDPGAATQMRSISNPRDQSGETPTDLRLMPLRQCCCARQQLPDDPAVPYLMAFTLFAFLVASLLKTADERRRPCTPLGVLANASLPCWCVIYYAIIDG